jgi:GNAT superfamily N-acetyltransferase
LLADLRLHSAFLCSKKPYALGTFRCLSWLKDKTSYTLPGHSSICGKQKQPGCAKRPREARPNLTQLLARSTENDLCQKHANLLECLAIIKRSGRQEADVIEIRDAVSEDKEQVLDLCRQLMSSATIDSPVNQPSGEATFHELIATSKGDIIVAVEEGVMLGLVTLAYLTAIRCGGIYASIEEFIVTEKARGKGIGGKLLKAAIKHATEAGCPEFVVQRPSDLGLPVYLKHGWKDAGKLLHMTLPQT